ncbi:unknown protein [Seminavis robusta]|uniref:MYND-type domain-containing protein n=1 Tax=Seminavis robusta TaxID=568900 RepID=A0A9N8H6T9_9STRA|nr:unknown protein [Seminavis robusta]|eukprot:Sro52_g031100.1 n/a (391) ;mRNA; f:96686-97858
MKTKEVSALFLPSEVMEEDEETKTSKLWECYQHAAYLVRSRAHEGPQPREPVLNPLFDLFNGQVYGVKEDPRNVRVIPAVVQERSLMCEKAMAAGDEMIIIYGIHTATSFILRYGFCPKDFVTSNGGDLVDEVFLWIPKSLGSPDELRSRATRKLVPSTAPGQLFEDCVTQLTGDMLDQFSVGVQVNYDVILGNALRPDNPVSDHSNIQRLRQFLVLNHLLDDDCVREAMKTCRLRGWNDFYLSHLLQLIIDHVITSATSLSTSNNQQDLQKANDPKTPHDVKVAYLARVAQRDALARWRHAFAWHYGSPSEHSSAFYHNLYAHLEQGGYERKTVFSPNHPIPQAPRCLLESKGCHYCGRTLHLRSCAGCKETQYCCREHQKLDRKRHKY